MACKATAWVEYAEAHAGSYANETFDIRLRVLPHDEDYSGEGTVLVESIGASITLLGITDACKQAVIDEITNNGVSFTPVIDSVRILQTFSLA